jgi:phage-related tail fiber protein
VIYVFIATKTTADVALPVPAFSQGEYNRRVSNAFKASTGGHLVVGDLKLRPNGNAVQNHLLCDGSEVSRIQFPELFALLGETEGAGDGATTFNLPNYLGEALAVPETGPVQTITEHGTVANPIPVTEPTEPGEVGGTEGGNILSGGRALKRLDI